MEFTPLGIPRSLRPAFQEYDLEKLDPDRDAFTVVERTLAYGNHQELAWLFHRYRRDYLISWVQRWGERRLPRIRLKFWAVYLQVQEKPERRGAWPH